MIRNTQDQATCDIFAGVNSRAARKLPQKLHRKAKLLLELLNAAHDVQDMASPPGNRLHKLTGSLAGFWAISINDQYRIIFRFNKADASDVIITDYH
ncbi:MAG: type II toxin-antitoxin system RelE/ParE family toxin [Vampirovibrionales bacterium]|nr:type II toxin-antitoxin system RelE/ParE family toxin [Vampirovibrionales bacterium]